jgi:hypothetical protein
MENSEISPGGTKRIIQEDTRKEKGEGKSGGAVKGNGFSP